MCDLIKEHWQQPTDDVKESVVCYKSTQLKVTFAVVCKRNTQLKVIFVVCYKKHTAEAEGDICCL